MSPNFLPPKQAYFPDFVDEADIEEKKSAPLKWKLGTRVLPVFVFSVLQVHSSRFLMNYLCGNETATKMFDWP